MSQRWISCNQATHSSVRVVDSSLTFRLRFIYVCTWSHVDVSVNYYKKFHFEIHQTRWRKNMIYLYENSIDKLVEIKISLLIVICLIRRLFLKMLQLNSLFTINWNLIFALGILMNFNVTSSQLACASSPPIMVRLKHDNWQLSWQKFFRKFF